MSMLPRHLRFVFLVSAGLLLSAAPAPRAQFQAGEPLTLQEWTVLGAFPNPEDKTLPGDCTRKGFQTDYLQPLGGETAAVIGKECTVNYTDTAGTAQEARAAAATANAGGTVNFGTLFKDSDFKVAYAYAVLKSDKAQEASFAFGSDDSAKVWINGRLVHEKAVRSRGITLGDDFFTAPLVQGENRILVKVENGIFGWGFILQGYDKETAAKIKFSKEIQECEVFPVHKDRYVFRGDTFPRLTWDAGDEVVRGVGAGKPLPVRWFDAGLREVAAPKEPGRYTAYVELPLPDGSRFRRSLTFCKAPETLRGYNLDMQVSFARPPNGSGVTRAAWNSHLEALTIAGEGVLEEGFMNSPAGAMLLAYALEMKETDTPASTLDNPWIRDVENGLALKRKILGAAAPKTLRPPATAAPAVPVLTPGTAAAAGMQDTTPAKLREVCAEWARDGEQPFVALVARNGTVFFHEAFGKAERDEKFEAASITKAVSGMLFAQFIDQGLMSPDDPLGMYLPDFPTTGGKVLTLRHCLNHVSGLNGHFEWGGVHNPWLDNVIANGLETLRPGKVYNYNGMGFDLTGLAMESVTGKSVLRLFQENLFLPLGMKNVYQWDMACATRFSAEDFGKLAQLLLNQGAYGDRRFFSPETFAKIAPQPLETHFPDVKKVYGFGLDYLAVKDPEAGKNGVPEDRVLLGKRLLGHGAASSSVLRADLDHGLVIIVARNDAGRNYGQHLAKFLKTLEDGLK